MRGYDNALGIELELETQKGQVRQLRQLVALDATGKSHPIPITDDMRNNPEKLRAAYLALNFDHPVHGYVIGDPEELICMEPLIKAAFPSASFGAHGTCDKNYQGAAVKMELSDRYFRAIANDRLSLFPVQVFRRRPTKRFAGEAHLIVPTKAAVAKPLKPTVTQ